jgi:hypothetical protein
MSAVAAFFKMLKKITHPVTTPSRRKVIGIEMRRQK